MRMAGPGVCALADPYKTQFVFDCIENVNLHGHPRYSDGLVYNMTTSVYYNVSANFQKL